jgi:cytidylate kinase
MPTIVTIDGPAGAGKSSVARSLAKRLGFRFLDTGAMYRAVAMAGIQQGVELSDSDALARLAQALEIDVNEDRVLLNGIDVTAAIRTSEVTGLTHYAADNPGVRSVLVELQRRAAAGQNLVTEGRDQGTVVFPNAQCKIFLTASASERARRRMEDLRSRGETPEFDQVLAQQEQRDQRDRDRSVGPLVLADEAHVVVTDGLTHEQVVNRLEELVHQSQAT